MKLPFTLEQFISVFNHYNTSVFPMQIVLNLFAVLAIALLFTGKKYSNKFISFILGLLWLWTGVVYHILFFTAINKAAYVFGALYVVQGILFVVFGILKEKLVFQFSPNFVGITGLVFIFYALVLYPVLGFLAGHIYPNSPTFGAPCPITIFTFGMLLLTQNKLLKFLIIIPLLWSIIGLVATVKLKITEDIGLFISGVLGTILIFIKDRKNNIRSQTLNS